MRMNRCGYSRFEGWTQIFDAKYIHPEPLGKSIEEPSVCSVPIQYVYGVNGDTSTYNFKVQISVEDFGAIASEFASRISVAGSELSSQLARYKLVLKQLAACAEGLSLQPIEDEATIVKAS